MPAHRVAAQQACTFDDVLADPSAANDNRSQAKPTSTVGSFNQNSSEQTTDTAESVENHVHAGKIVFTLPADDLDELFVQKLAERLARLLVAQAEPRQIDGQRGTELQLRQCTKQRERFFQRQLTSRWRPPP